MNYKTFGLELGIILVVYLLMMIPAASATSVNVLFDGQTQATLDISPQNLVNKQVTISHDPTDVAWKRVKVRVAVSSASLAKAVSKIYLYKCKTMDPVECVKGEPLVFETYIDTELAWEDISQTTDTGFYPQAANLLLLVKLEGDRTTWAGFWDRIERTGYNTFDTYFYELNSIDFYVKSLDLVEPVRYFIENYQMIPFNWADRVIFTAANKLYAMGANTNELNVPAPAWQTASPQSNTIDAIAKDFSFVLSDTTSGITNPITLTRNPSFTCGDGQCEADLGESPANCCYDCGCDAEEYCNLQTAEGTAGSCQRLDLISLEVLPVTSPQLTGTQCTQPFELEIPVRINNPPSGLGEKLPAVVILNETPYSITCTGTPVRYNCPVTLTSKVACGVGTYLIGPNKFGTTLSFRDGPNQVSRDLESGMSQVSVNYNCGCEPGYYCDSGTKTCLPEASVGLSVTDVTSFLENYQPGQNIELTVKITNPPGDLTIPTKEYNLGNLSFDGSSVTMGGGTLDCTERAGSPHVYDCVIPFNIDSYTHEKQYTIRGNSVRFVLNFPSGGTTVTKDLTSSFSDITIPSYRCGDLVCNPEENKDNCCLDCGCYSAGQYCDPQQGCQDLDGVNLGIELVDPQYMAGCKQQHNVDIRANIGNAPTGAVIDKADYYINNQLSVWKPQCTQPNGGITECTIALGPFNGDCQGTEVGDYEVGPNRLDMTVTFTDGHNTQTKDISAAFESLYIEPTFVCGDNVCETALGESGENCCIDCVCESSDYFTTPDGSDNSEWYCDYDPQDQTDGTCRKIGGIELVIDQPQQTVSPEKGGCEVTQHVNIKAHIANAPAGLRVEGWSATLGGQDVQYLNCRQEEQFGNTSYNCTIRIPPIYNCTAGSITVYGTAAQPNTITAYISYPNGRIGKDTLPLTETFPSVSITQMYRSIYDMTLEWKVFVMDKVTKIEDEVEHALNDLERCITMMIQSTILMLALMFVVPAFTGGDYFKGVEAMAETTDFTLTAIGKLCDMVKQKHDLVTQKYRAQINVQTMRFCIDRVHHEMDIGRCNGQEQACFDQIVGCLTSGFDELDKVSDQMSKITNNIVQDAKDIADAAKDMAKAWDAALEKPGAKTFSVTCGDSLAICCDYNGVKSGTKTTIGTGGIITVENKEEGCTPSKLKVTVRGVTGCETSDLRVTVDGKDFPLGTELVAKAQGWIDGHKIEVALYCGKEFIDLTSITYVEDKDDPSNCYCDHDELPEGVTTGAAETPLGSTSASLSSDAKTAVNKAITQFNRVISLESKLENWAEKAGEVALSILTLGISGEFTVEETMEDAIDSLQRASGLSDVTSNDFKNAVEEAKGEAGDLKSHMSGLVSEISKSTITHTAEDVKTASDQVEAYNNGMAEIENALKLREQAISAKNVNLKLSNLKVNPSEVKKGEDVIVNFTVENTGTSTVDSYMYRVKWDTAKDEKTGSAIANGSSEEISYPLKTGTLTAKTYNVVVEIYDVKIGGEVSGESSISDNTVSGKSFTIKGIPAVVKTVPSTQPEGQSFSSISYLQVDFSEAMNWNTCGPGQIKLTGPLGDIELLSMVTAGNTIKFTPKDVNTLPGGEYTLEVKGCKSSADVTATDYSKKFKISKRPKIIQYVPGKNDVGVVLNKQISIKFDTIMTADPLINVKSSKGEILLKNPRWASDKRTYIWEPSANYEKATQYTVTVTSAKDTLGNQMEQDSWTFTTVT